MNVWWINHYAVGPDHVGGTRHYSLGRELARRDYDVSIIAANFNHFAREFVPVPADAPFGEETIEGVRFLWVRSPSYTSSGVRRLWSMLHFARALRRAALHDALPAPDVVIGSSPHPFAALEASRLARRFGVPFVLEVRDLWPRTLAEIGGLSKRHPLYLWLARVERELYRTASRIVSVLPGGAEHIARHGGAREKVVWIPNGIDLSLLPPAGGSERHEGFRVMYAGSHGPANALDTVLEAAQRIERERAIEDCSFVFVGGGPDKARLEGCAAAWGLRSVRFEPPCSKRALYKLLAGADAFVATLRDSPLYTAGMSLNKLFDYLALGKPVVFGADVPSNPVADSGAGTVVPPEDAVAMADALGELAALPRAERRAIGGRGRAYVERYHDCAQLADRLCEVLAEVVSRP